MLRFLKTHESINNDRGQRRTHGYSINLIIKFIEDPTLKHEASVQRFLRKLKKKNFNENEYDKLYPPVSAPARAYGTPKMHKFFSGDSFSKLRRTVSSIGYF